MKLAETVTFGGSGLNRAAELRDRPGEIARLAREPDARTLPIWRGKPLFAGPERAPGWLAPEHAVFDVSTEDAVFLGFDEDAPRFARDVSDWEPEEEPDTLGAFFDPSEQTHPELPKGYVFAELRGAMTLLTPRAAELVATAKAILAWHITHRHCARCGASSDVSHAGWQRTCRACNAHHFPRTDPVVIMLITANNAVLVGRSHGWPEGMYSLLAGFVEPGETLEAAVRREVFEEAGIAVGQVDYLASQPWPFPASLMFGCHGQALSTDITLDPAEIEDARWVSRETMRDVVAGEMPQMRAARKGSIAHFLITHWLADTLD